MSIFLESERLYLKPVSASHCTEEYVSWLNDKEVTAFLESGLFPYSLVQLEDYIKQIESSNALFLAIHIKSNNKHIGNIKIENINSIHQRAEYGIMMGDKNEWQKGYAKEASQCIINYCFERLNLRKITLGVVKDNDNAFALYKKIGFEVEGELKKHSFHQGKFSDVIRMAVFNPYYQA